MNTRSGHREAQRDTERHRGDIAWHGETEAAAEERQRRDRGEREERQRRDRGETEAEGRSEWERVSGYSVNVCGMCVNTGACNSCCNSRLRLSL